MLNTIFLIYLAATLVIFLLWRKTPRPILFEALINSAWIFSIAFFLTINLTDKFSPNLIDGLLPYIPPIIPVVAFLTWYLPRAKVNRR